MSARSVAIFDKAMRDYGVSRDGKNWLLQAIDPYHDTDVPPTGYPDTNVSGSIVQVVKRSMNIKCPSTISSGNWDCNVFNLPHAIETEYSNNGPDTPVAYNPKGASMQVVNSTGGSGKLSVGGVVAISGDSSDVSIDGLGGLNLTTMVAESYTGSTAKVSYDYLALDSDAYFGGESRLVAWGFEVVNTTSDLNRQGLVAAYRQPQSRDNAVSVLVQGPGTYPTAPSRVVTAHLMNDAPGKMEDVMLLTGTRQWKAAEGGYCTCTFNGLQNPSGPMTPSAYFLNSGSYRTGTTSEFGAFSCCYAPVSGPEEFSRIPVDPPRFNTSGLYFTGLSHETTLTVNVVYYVERFPSTNEQTLVVLAKPSVSYDSVAFEIYARCLAFMPPGVPQFENGIGDWFKSVVGAIPKVARTVAPVLGMIPHPAGQALSMLAGSVGKLGSPPPGKVYTPSGALKPVKQNPQKKSNGFSRQVQAIETSIGRKLTKAEKATLRSKSLAGI